MKINLLFAAALLLPAPQMKAQDFQIGPYQDFALASTVLADFNEDDYPDVLGIHFSPNPNVLVLQINNGSATIDFTQQQLNLSFDAVGQPAAGDFDGDSDMDIAIARGANADIYILKNDGTAHFTIDTLGITGVDILRVVDIENDGDLDIAGLNTATNLVKLFVNNGNEVFSTIDIISNANNLDYFDTGDLDNDGDADFAFGYDQPSGKQVVIYKNDGSNNFTEIVLSTDQFNYVESLSVDDINSDGKLDIIVLKTFSCEAFINQGNSVFTKKNMPAPSGILRSFATGDYNGDSKLDIMIGTNSEGVHWFKNLSNETLTFESHYVGGTSPAFSIDGGDLDNDGDEDVVISNGEFRWYENKILQEPVSTFEFTENNITVYPNPVQGVLQINTNQQNFYTLNITDVDGRILWASKVTSGSIDLSFLRPGAYVLTISNAQTGEIKSTPLFKI